MGGGEGVFFSPQWHGTDRSCGDYKPWKIRVAETGPVRGMSSCKELICKVSEGDSAYYYLRLRPVDGHRAWLRLVWLDWAK